MKLFNMAGGGKTDEPARLRSVFKNILENTSAHGLPNIDRAPNGFRKCFWSLLFMWALGMFMWQCYELIYAYFQWDVDVNIDIQYKNELDFPAISICNLNPVKASTIRHNDRLNSLLGVSDEAVGVASSTTAPVGTPAVTADDDVVDDGVVTITYVDDSTAVGQGTDPSYETAPANKVPIGETVGALTEVPDGLQQPTTAVTPEELAAGSGKNRRRKRGSETSESSPRGYQDWNNIDYMTKDDKLDLFDQVTDALAQTRYEERDRFGHEIDDMLLACSYKGYPCGPSNFTYFYNYLYGNCYTFNAGINDSIKTSSKSGPLYGLVLEFNVEETEYISDIQQAAGVRVLIGEQYRMPFPEDSGINVAPGLLSSIGVRRVEIERQPFPYGNCTEQDSVEAASNIFSNFFNVNYSLQACQKDCLYNSVLEMCECADSRFKFHHGVKPCLSTNNTQVLCKETVERLYADDEIECNCTSPCQESSFELTVSSAAWPNTLYEGSVRQDLLDISDVFRSKVGSDPDFVQNNVLKLQVYYEQLNYEKVTQTPKYDGFGLVSNLGGQVGLWIGISMCTVFEFVELMYDVCKILILKLLGLGYTRRATAPSVVEIELRG